MSEWTSEMKRGAINSMVVGGFLGALLMGVLMAIAGNRALDSQRDRLIDQRNEARETAHVEGRCIELCRPEEFVETVNHGTECLCATKRVRLP